MVYTVYSEKYQKTLRLLLPNRSKGGKHRFIAGAFYKRHYRITPFIPGNGEHITSSGVFLFGESRETGGKLRL